AARARQASVGRPLPRAVGGSRGRPRGPSSERVADRPDAAAQPRSDSGCRCPLPPHIIPPSNRVHAAFRARRPHPVALKDAMKAIRKVAPRPGALEWADVPMPPCGPTEVLLRVRAASLCGTDAHIYNWDGSVRDMILTTTDQLRVPRIIGHEFCGEVLEVGRDVRGVGDSAAEGIRPGDLVSAESPIVCAHCYHCRRGQLNVSTRERILGVHRDGGFAEYIALPASCAWLNDPALVPVEAACIEEP